MIDPRIEHVILTELDRLDRLARLFRTDPLNHASLMAVTGASEAAASGWLPAEDRSDVATGRRAA